MDLPTILQTAPTFADFTQSELEVLERAMRVDEFPAGHVFVKEGGKDRNLYVILDGEVQLLHKHSAGQGFDDLGVLTSGDLFGLQSLVYDQPRYSECRAITPVSVASLPKPVFDTLYNLHFSLAERFQYIIARQMVRELRRLDEAVAAAMQGGDIGLLSQAAADVRSSSG